MPRATWTKGKGDLVYPVQKKEEPEREYGPLELEREQARETASKALSTLRNLSEVRGGIFSKDQKKADTLDNLILVVAQCMLGDDWDCEILC